MTRTYDIYQPPKGVEVTVRWRGDLWLLMVTRPGWPGWDKPKIAEVADFMDVPDEIERLLR